MLVKSSNVIAQHGAKSAQLLLVFLEEQPKEFQHKLIPNLDYIDPRALNDNGITLLEVSHIAGNQYTLSYQYDWFVFSGCTDTDLTGTDKNKVSFNISENGDLTFDLSALGL
ncbi:hypothetical protein [Vibrio rumoiensis]|uniref:Uncharacterized protein n=1 Tax=Vibrio rumoiensis 1S-45 TaxID=1188252 RepID=A0A1E5E5Q5_9VIBR|nr:hypothetical protein [Vibrio rumoiensis]OEF29177.1 hypothetical protein A1QC_04440 [Vibrio rumoiensis 1S-45]